MKDFTLKGATLALVIIAALQPAAGQDAPFTFNVRVDVDDLHAQVSHIHVRCGVYGDVEGLALGVGEKLVPLRQRSFRGTVPVAIQMGTGKAGAAQRYACRLRLKLANGQIGKPSASQSNIALRASPAAQFVDVISGSL